MDLKYKILDKLEIVHPMVIFRILEALVDIKKVGEINPRTNEAIEVFYNYYKELLKDKIKD